LGLYLLLPLLWIESIFTFTKRKQTYYDSTYIGFLLVILSVLTFALTMVDGVAIIFSLIVLLLSGLMALTGKIKYTIIVLLITTLNISSTVFLMADESLAKENQENNFPNLLPPVPTPVISVENLKEISKETGIPLEKLKNISIAETNTGETSGNKRSIFQKLLFLLKLISIPYIITFILLLIGYRVKKQVKKNSVTN